MRGRQAARVCLILSIALACMLGGCSRKEEEQGTPLARLGEDTIYLEEAVFYTRMLQEQWEYSYYEIAGNEMWHKEFDEEGRTFAEALKSDVLDTLTDLHLLCAHAGEYGVELTGEEKREVSRRAAAFMSSNTPAVLEAAGATQEYVETLLLSNELAAKVAASIQDGYEPELDEDRARVGKLTYCLFSTMGIYDAEGNHTPFTPEELAQIREDAEGFAIRARELGDISAAGEEISHTVIDAYYNEETDGGAHELVAETVRKMNTGQISDPIETDDGYYVVQRVSDYDEAATIENREALRLEEKERYQIDLLESWKEETAFVLDEELWDTVAVDRMLTEAE